MKACEDFEEQLLDYSELADPAREAVDVHLQACANCREFLNVLAELDTALSRAYEKVSAPDGIQSNVLTRIETEGALRPMSVVPELLDFIGWASVAVIVCMLAWPIARASFIETSWRPASATVTLCAFVFFAGATLVGVRAYSELKD
jgi:predicted anti-sigma-YlaC factor YlaD